MIIKASERGSAKDLARHLLNEHDGNEHITLHELNGFMSEDLEGALEEAYAISRGTKCQKPLFSCSFNPPSQEDVSIETFEDAIRRVEEKNGLSGQPRAIVFHEKEGRRHAHAVWSRIDAETMTAKNLSHYKLKCQDISRELYHEHNWQMPNGLARKQSDPRNYSLVEYAQSKRMKVDPRDLKGAIRDAYATSDSAKSFAHALSEQGFALAKGDRRGHVAISHSGEVISISRYVGKRAKEVSEKLGEPDDTLPSVDAAKLAMTQDMRKAFIRHTKEVRSLRDEEQDRLKSQQLKLHEQHKTRRHVLEQQQKDRWIEETKVRSDRLNSGLRGLWQLVTGQRTQIQKQNIEEAQHAQKRDRQESNELIARQLQERQDIKAREDLVSKQHDQTMQDLREDQARAREQQRALQDQFRQTRETAQKDAGINTSPPQKPPSRDGPEIER